MIPDSHVRPDAGIERFKWLGKLISAEKPDVVVHLGDLWDMPSLCSYDRGTIHLEGKCYKADIASGIKAIELLDRYITKCTPRKLFCIGNHEFRIVKAVEQAANLDGLLSMDDLKLKEHGWEVFGFLDVVLLGGISFSHYFISGVMGRPVSGENAAANLLKKTYASCIAGHSHLYDYAERTTIGGRKIQAIVAGCFLEPGQKERYAGPANLLWRSAVTVLHHVDAGEFDHEVVGVKRLKDQYG